MEFSVLVLLIGIHTGYGVSLCGNVTEHGSSLSLSPNNGGGTGCWCMLGLIGSNNDTVFVTERVVPGGCQYMLQFHTSNGFSRNYSCTTFGNFSFPLQHGGSVMIQLVVGHETAGGFTVDISLSTKSSHLSLTCNLPISTTNPPAKTPRVITTPAPRVIRTPAPRFITTYYASTQIPVISIIVWSVAGFFFITTMMIIICCLVKRKATKNTNSPATTEYVDISTMSPNITNNTTPSGDSSYLNVSTISPNITDNTYDRLNYNNNNIDHSQTGTEYTVLKR